MGTAGSGSASSLVRSMKKARDDPQAREKTDTMTPTIIVGGKLPGISDNFDQGGLLVANCRSKFNQLSPDSTLRPASLWKHDSK